jgi:hypothetical protein
MGVGVKKDHLKIETTFVYYETIKRELNKRLI